MDDKDHIFARFKDDKPAANDRHELLNIPRKGSVAGSRVVEVAHVRSGGAVRENPPRLDAHVRAASWEGGFPAKQTYSASLPVEPVATKTAQPVIHVMPAWNPAADVAGAAPSALSDEPFGAARRGRRRPRKQPASTTTRRIADPFNADDDGANCIRCGYAVEPAREKRGLMTCSECV